MQRPRPRFFVYLTATVVLILALIWGHARAVPDLTGPIREIFPAARTIVEERGVFRLLDADDRPIGWAAAGRASGYGGPLLLLAGVDPEGRLVGARVVEQRETPIFWRMVRVDRYLAGVAGSRYDGVSYDYEGVAGVTGATVSSDALVAGLRDTMARIADGAFDVRLPEPRRPFEFGLLELTVLALFTVGIVARRVGGTARRRLRWAAQITGLIVLGFWESSPITLPKLAALASGFFPDPRTGLALYVLIAGFLITSMAWGRNIYCLYACPFGAAQRCVGALGGKSFKLPLWAVRLMEGLRDGIVFAALFLAFLTLRPTLAGYEPFAALFSLEGSNLQWLLLFVVLVLSLVVRTPWCDFWCPMRTIENALREVRNLFRRPAEQVPDE